MKNILLTFLFITIPLFANCTEYEKNETSTNSFTTIDSTLIDLSYSEVEIETDSNNKNTIYFSNNTLDPDVYYRVNLREKGFDYECSDNNFINIENVSTLTDTDEKTVMSVSLISYIFLLDDNFKITADLTAPNVINSFSYSTPTPSAIVQIGNSSTKCNYIATNDSANETISFELNDCPVLVKIQLDDGSTEQFSASLSNNKLLNISKNENSYDHYFDSDLLNSSNEKIGYFRFYMNAKFEFLDLTKTPL